MSMDTYGIIGFTTDNVGIDRRFYTGRTDTDPTLPVSYNERRVDVYLNGIKLVGDHPGNSNHDYDINSQTGQGSSITLKTGVALVASDVIECIGYVSLSGNTVTSHNPTPTSGDGGYNEFRNIGQASSDLLNVYLNGVLLDDSDYTSDPTTNSGTVTIGSPAITASDVVVIQVIGTLNNSNFVPASGGDFTGNVTTTGEIHTDDIKEKTSAHGVEIDGVTLKDGSGTFNRGTDGESVSLQKSASTVGTIGVSSDGPAFGTATQQIALHNGKLFPAQAYGSALDNTMDLGYSSSRFKDLYLSGNVVIGTAGHGINFSATSDGSGASNVNEVLSDYEQGTFTPLLKGVDGDPTIGGSKLARYTKVGNVVHFNILIDSGGTFTGGSGQIFIKGFPFNFDSADAGNAIAINVSLWGPTIGSGKFIAGQGVGGDNSMKFKIWQSGGGQTFWTYSTASMSTGHAIYVQGHYFVA